MKQARSWFLGFLPKQGRVLDLGCGRGEVLELLQEQGYEAVGVETDNELVRICSEKGLNVANQDVISYLGTNPGPWDGIFIGHLIEHLPVKRAYDLLSGAWAALRAGGRIILLTPNPNWLPGTGEFWSDPTHVRPYSISALSHMLQSIGFFIIDTGVDPASRLKPNWERPLHAITDYVRLFLLKLIMLEYYNGGEIYIIAEKR
jgi:SAM-dependent methyltransferase